MGRILQDGSPVVKIFGEEIDVRAHIETMDGISGHADVDGLIAWASAFEKRPEYVFVVHGDETSCTAFSDVLNNRLKLKARAPFSGSQFDLIEGCWIKETEGVPVEKETAAKRKATAFTPVCRMQESSLWM